MGHLKAATKRSISEVRDVILKSMSPIHAAGPVVEPGNWAKNDPFLLMMEDEFQKGSFDLHPHRGMETVTYVIAGQIEHYDTHSGEGGVLGPGDVQWMTAGSGVEHNEVPSEGLIARSLQLWVNLPREHKMTKPRYQNLKSEAMPIRQEKGATIKVFSGSSKDTVSSTLNYVPVTMVEMLIEPGFTVTQDLPGSYNGFIYVLEGSGTFGQNNEIASQSQVLWLGEGGSGTSEIDITAINPLRLLLYAGEPLKEPVVARGPFVMNTEREITEAFSEYRQGTFLK
ncbi:pirin family protein [Paenibacillus monticola]|uniref:Pirin family protein n=1 Tax=Paenibacillus monticola TaxID=2666075 RepID=A0A7X2L3N1_9BACL|nr:pirin-like C-terminal cupin domain-containing protein [Paenibacillus monticola]MRN55599.1 pirin family protein [Paenibacillus monticola]